MNTTNEKNRRNRKRIEINKLIETRELTGNCPLGKINLNTCDICLVCEDLKQQIELENPGLKLINGKIQWEKYNHFQKIPTITMKERSEKKFKKIKTVVEIIASSENDFSCWQIKQKLSKEETVYLLKILRYLTSINMIQKTKNENGKRVFLKTNKFNLKKILESLSNDRRI